jgi:hypothetical protein
MEKREIEFSTRLTRADVAGLIEALIEGLKDGKLKIKKSSEELELDVPRVVDLEIEASIDDERAEFEIEVSWRTNRAENPDLPLDENDGTESAAPKPRGKAAAKKTAEKKPAAKKTTAAAKSPAKSKTAEGSKKSTGAKETKSPAGSATKSKAAAKSKE